jgi:hypothetical protein
MGKFRFIARNVVRALVESGGVDEHKVAINADALDEAYTAAEDNYIAQSAPGDVDFAVFLSGRSELSGSYAEDANKVALCPSKFDPEDTLNRARHIVNYAIRCMKNKVANGIYRPTMVYFNGVKRQNDELRRILDKDGSFLGLPAQFFIIDSIPLDNTMGQVIGFSKYLFGIWDTYSKFYNIKRPPNTALGTSTYHAYRVALAFGNTSPLHTFAFWKSRPDLLQQLPDEMKYYVLYFIESSPLVRAKIMVAGCDKNINERPFGSKDLFCDMQASVNYSSEHNTPHPPMKQLDYHDCPTIAPILGDNIVLSFIDTGSGALLTQSVIHTSRKFLMFGEKNSKSNSESTDDLSLACGS